MTTDFYRLVDVLIAQARVRMAAEADRARAQALCDEILALTDQYLSLTAPGVPYDDDAVRAVTDRSHAAAHELAVLTKSTREELKQRAHR